MVEIETGEETVDAASTSNRPRLEDAPAALWCVCPSAASAQVVEVPDAGGTVGRAGPGVQAELRLDDGAVSRRHARLQKVAGSWWCEDLGSRNGTFVAGVAAPPEVALAVEDGTVLRFGQSVAVFRQPIGVADTASSEFLPGGSRAMACVRAAMARLAPAVPTILVLGETGTGKEFAARALHQRFRVGGLLVPVNVGELTPGLARAELFGAAAGAFTGATTDRMGLVASAEGGTLFLDEVGDMPLEAQVDLLRFLQDRTYRRVGENILRRADVLVLAATNLDLDRAVAEGRFRRDLLGRLREYAEALELPPLRARPEDIPDWIRRFQLPDDPLPARAGFLEALMLYDWPENLRELGMTIRAARSLALSQGLDALTTEQLSGRVASAREAARATELASLPMTSTVAIGEDVGEVDAETLREILAATGGNIRQTALQLGKSRRAIYRLCEKWDQRPEDFRR